MLQSGQVVVGDGKVIDIEMCRYVDNLPDAMKAADLVISHAGAGSIFEALSLGKHQNSRCEAENRSTRI